MDASISWSWLLPGVLAAAVGVAAIVVDRRQIQGRLSFLALGGATWIGSVALKAAWALSTNSAIHHWLTDRCGSRIGEPIFWLYIGLLTGIFEVGATIAVARVARMGERPPRDAFSFGIGFGAIEAILMGVLGTVPVLILLVAPRLLPTEARDAIVSARGGSMVIGMIVPPLERFSTLIVHVLTCVWVAEAFRTRRWRWAIFAFTYKSLVDAAAAWGILSLGVKTSPSRLVGFEAGLLVFSLASVCAALYFRPSRRTVGVQSMDPRAAGAA